MILYIGIEYSTSPSFFDFIYRVGYHRRMGLMLSGGGGGGGGGDVESLPEFYGGL